MPDRQRLRVDLSEPKADADLATLRNRIALLVDAVKLRDFALATLGVFSLQQDAALNECDADKFIAVGTLDKVNKAGDQLRAEGK